MNQQAEGIYKRGTWIERSTRTPKKRGVNKGYLSHGGRQKEVVKGKPVAMTMGAICLFFWGTPCES